MNNLFLLVILFSNYFTKPIPLDKPDNSLELRPERERDHERMVQWRLINNPPSPGMIERKKKYAEYLIEKNRVPRNRKKLLTIRNSRCTIIRRTTTKKRRTQTRG